MTRFVLTFKTDANQMCASAASLEELEYTLSQIEIYPASKETIVKPGILRKAFWVFKT